MPGALSFHPAAERDLAELSSVFNRAFEGYVGGQVAFDAASFAAFLVGQNVSLGLSRLVALGGQPVGLAMVSRRGTTSRLVVMGLAAEARGRGAGRAVMAHLIAEARARGDRRLELEVIEQNPPAVRLYERAGFGKVQHLLSFVAEPHGGQAAALGPLVLEPMDIAEVARLVVVHGDPDLPWQLDGFQLAHIGPPATAYRCGDAFAVLSDPAQPTVRLLSLLTLPEARRRGQATRLLRALFAHYPERRWVMSALLPEPYAPVLLGAGFVPDRLSQFRMALEL